ncbi:CDP-diacylglycerol--glycerol-3-phosphate 3-phosphatidyltransferase [Alkaliphilus hydrothermalis]|uniref:CDP-diacylglycerol--glycerol-3-phosphate 3-phosphatidyltransferase n=1 Tax=Alkaliphilus hydrothermalis TaxID=1482730 RepID=A0ABS2NTL7_9FIRM|nr:CDP-diacylglycerol--glycerol-3-phosphate 3-phosphatidyltransferase [Alkaliphilus hydrothermalis]MBM7616319.1 cardiolipin synthase [Alkaliphilus hydrothermalis]
MNVPNFLTVARFFLIPCFVMVFFSQSPNSLLYAVGIFVVAGLTDLLDGFIARKYGLITKWGQAMDPLADKMMLLTVLICFTIAGYIPLWIITIVGMKEALLVIGGLILYTKKDKVVVPANKYGKLATIAFYIAIIWMGFDRVYGGVMLTVAVIITAYAFIRYLMIGVKLVKYKEAEQGEEKENVVELQEAKLNVEKNTTEKIS